MRFAVGMVSVLVVSLAVSAQSTEHGQAPGATVSLFDGTNLDRFYTFLRDRGRDSDPKRVFSVQDGLLRITGEEWGCITTHEAFENYHLVAEFKWAGPTWGDRADRARDSGILLHSNGPDGAYSGVWMHSIECQIIEGGTGDILVVADNSGERVWEGERAWEGERPREPVSDGVRDPSLGSG